MILETQLLLCFCKAAATALFATRHRTWQEVLVTNLQVLARKLSMYLLTSPLPPRTSNVVATGHTIKTQGPHIWYLPRVDVPNVPGDNGFGVFLGSCNKAMH